MKLLEIKWKNHPILGDLYLDFRHKEDSTPYENIVFIGENGSGKTTVMQSIVDFMAGLTSKFFEYIKYEAQGKIYTAAPLELERDGFYTVEDEENNKIEMRINKIIHNDKLDKHPANIRKYGFAYSKARSDFKTTKITSTTTKKLDDDEKRNSDDSDDYTELKQLLIDVQERDYEELDSWTNKQKNITRSTIDNFKKHNYKTNRFKTAFDNFFLNIKYIGYNTFDKEKKVILEKNNKEINIDDLSTGEKQIVFRGAYLLQNINNLCESIIFVDEPEISMHPLWQKKILKYYQEMFKENEVQKVQMFFSTHSTQIVKNAFDSNMLLIILSNNNGKISAQRMDDVNDMSLNTITSAEINYRAFSFPSEDFHIALYSYIQTLSQTDKSVIGCDNYINLYINQYEPQNKYILQRTSTNGRTTYNTLPTLIRNHIDHPNNIYQYSETDLKESIELMIRIIDHNKSQNQVNINKVTAASSQNQVTNKTK